MKNQKINLPGPESPTEALQTKKPEILHRIPRHCTTPESAYQYVRSQNSTRLRCKLDVGTFITTNTDKYAARLMSDCANLNYACSEANNSAKEISARCIDILAGLWHAPEGTGRHSGVPTIGSSEACMIAGMAAWQRWEDRRIAEGKPHDKPNFVVSAARHEAWDKFSRFWRIEMRIAPLSAAEPTLDIEEAIMLCDENTICVVAIAGDTFTGQNDDIEALDTALGRLEERAGLRVPIHVDAAIGGFVMPFLYEDIKWDFRLERVVSINTSSHKFGLVYAGLGWVVWRDRKYSTEPTRDVPEGFHNTRPSAHIVAQYYQFIRLGFDGYRAVMDRCMEVAIYACRQISGMGPFECLSDNIRNPFFSFRLKPEYKKIAGWSMQDLRDKLRKYGWNVHIMCLPYEAEDREVLRLVFRRGMDFPLADRILDDIREIVAGFEGIG